MPGKPEIARATARQLAGTPEIGQILGGDGCVAVDHRRRIGRDVTGNSHHDRFIEGVHALVHTAESDQHPAAVVEADRLEVTVTEPEADVQDLFGQRERRIEIATPDRLAKARPQQPAVHDALWLALQESFGSPQPAGGDRALELLGEIRDEAERALRCSHSIACRVMGRKRSLPVGDGITEPTQPPRRLPETIKVVAVERMRRGCGSQQADGIRPAPLGKG
jgi:hypothetical protein